MQVPVNIVKYKLPKAGLEPALCLGTLGFSPILETKQKRMIATASAHFAAGRDHCADLQQLTLKGADHQA
jgi:hypothetical protein